jgi:uracil-DNA glycosylase
MEVLMEPGWNAVLQNEFARPYFKQLCISLNAAQKSGEVIYPENGDIFRAFNLTPFDQVKAVLLGQDPYHAPGQAHGLCFSVPKGVRLPPSLRNMYKELELDMGIPPASHGCLEAWAKQGLLMLNAYLTVRAGQPLSHSKLGWEQFTDAVIRSISAKKNGVVFLLWGKFAQQKESLIDLSRHFVLKAAHPSPLSAHNGFLGSKPFSKTNELLSMQGKSAIQWQIL